MAISKNAGVGLAVVGLVALAGAIAIVLRDREPGPSAAGVTITEITLVDDGNGGCKVTAKASRVTTKASHMIVWKIVRGDCRNRTEPVMIGNFREQAGSNAATCAEATEGSGAYIWPFMEGQEPEYRRGIGAIVLNTKPRNELPASELRLYYDVCTGREGDKKWDPELVIEPT
ncbi:MAG TPA: hypothetical protein VM364_12635 [Vicinamibacterales bacterium]|nr:hypothetical protein [Vicinamibacterales bacterium]